MCLKKSKFPAIEKFQRVPFVKIYYLVGLLSVVSKIFEQLVINRHVYHLERKWFSSDFEYSFGSFGSTVDLLTVRPNRVARVFNVSCTTPNVVIDISKAYDMVWHAGLLHKFGSYGISGQFSSLFSLFLIKSLPCIVLEIFGRMSYWLQLYSWTYSFLLYINDHADVMYVTIHATVSFDLWKLTSLFEGWNNSSSIDGKMNGSVLNDFFLNTLGSLGHLHLKIRSASIA